jgi:hypothetical protein
MLGSGRPRPAKLQDETSRAGVAANVPVRGIVRRDISGRSGSGRPRRAKLKEVTSGAYVAPDALLTGRDVRSRAEQ